MTRFSRSPFTGIQRMGAFVAICALLAACGKSASPPPEAPPVSVVSMTVRATDLVIAYKGSATLEAWDKADVASEITGQVRDVFRDEGDVVSAGALLARLDPSVLSASASEVAARLTDANIALSEARDDRDRIARLRKEGVASQEELDKAEVKLRRAHEGVAAIRGSSGAVEAQLARTAITAPIAGVVTRRWIERGETASTGKALFRVENLAALKAVLNVPEQDVGSMKTGDSVMVSVAGETEADRLLSGIVTYVSPAADAMARTVKVEARVDNRDAAIRSGVFATVSVIRSVRANAVAVPKTAVAYRADGTAALYVIEGGVVHRRDVKLGAAGETMVEVLSGLRTGETIVPIDVATLTDGVKVSAAGTGAASAPERSTRPTSDTP